MTASAPFTPLPKPDNYRVRNTGLPEINPGQAVYGGSPSISISLFTPKHLLSLFKIRPDPPVGGSFLIELQTNLIPVKTGQAVQPFPQLADESSVIFTARYCLVLWPLLIPKQFKLII